jgi:hypothetical protein
MFDAEGCAILFNERYIQMMRSRANTAMRNTMVAAECAVFRHLLGLSFSFPNWPSRTMQGDIDLRCWLGLSGKYLALLRLGLLGSLWDCEGRIRGMGSFSHLQPE